jgi:hypothetical protein
MLKRANPEKGRFAGACSCAARGWGAEACRGVTIDGLRMMRAPTGADARPGRGTASHPAHEDLTAVTARWAKGMVWAATIALSGCAAAPASMSAAPAPPPADVGPAPLVVPPAGRSAATADSPTVETGSRRAWEARAGETLRVLLEDWAAEAGWQVIWNTDREYPIRAGASFTGDFRHAARAAVRGFRTAAPPPKITFYRNNVAVIVTQGDDNGE